MACPLCMGVIPPPNPCCCSCDYCLDAFDALSTGTDISGAACVLTEEVGDWSITGSFGANKLRVSSANAICKIGAWSSDSDVIVSAVVTFAAGDNVRIMFDYVDDDNYLCGQFTHGGAITVIRRAAGVETAITSYTIATGFGSSGSVVACCYNASEGRFSAAWVRSNSDTPCMIVYETVTNHAFAIGTGSIASANIDFDSLRVEKSTGGNCERCQQATHCIVTDAVQPELQVDISGLANQSCGDCATLDGTYILDLWGKFPSEQKVYWHYEFPSAICGFNHLWAYTVFLLGFYRWQIVLTSGAAPTLTGDYIRWSGAQQTDKLDCDAASASGTLTTDASTQCAAAGSTADISVP